MSELITDLTLGVYRRLYSNFVNGQRICRLSRDAECWFWRVYATVDDFGNGQADPVLCLAATKGRRKERISNKQVERWLKEMFEVGLITFYWVKNEPYLHINQFCEKWQPKGRNGKQVKRFPGVEMADGDSRCIQVNPDLTNAPYSYSYSDPDPEKPISLAARARLVFEYWKTVMDKPRAVLDRKRERAITERLKTFDVESLYSAIRGCKKTPFNMGDNERQRPYNDIELICRDSKHVEEFMARAEDQEPVSVPTIREKLGIDDEHVRAITS